MFVACVCCLFVWVNGLLGVLCGWLVVCWVLFVLGNLLMFIVFAFSVGVVLLIVLIWT